MDPYAFLQAKNVPQNVPPLLKKESHLVALSSKKGKWVAGLEPAPVADLMLMVALSSNGAGND
jgi:hypothetical protein